MSLKKLLSAVAFPIAIMFAVTLVLASVSYTTWRVYTHQTVPKKAMTNTTPRFFTIGPAPAVPNSEEIKLLEERFKSAEQRTGLLEDEFSVQEEAKGVKFIHELGHAGPPSMNHADSKVWYKTFWFFTLAFGAIVFLILATMGVFRSTQASVE